MIVFAICGQARSFVQISPSVRKSGPRIAVAETTHIILCAAAV